MPSFLGGALHSMQHQSWEKQNPMSSTPSRLSLWSVSSAEDYRQSSFSKEAQQAASRQRQAGQISGYLGTFADLPSGPVLIKPGLGAYLDLLLRSRPCSSSLKLCKSQLQVVSYTGLYQSPSQSADPTHLMASFRKHQRRI